MAENAHLMEVRIDFACWESNKWHEEPWAPDLEIRHGSEIYSRSPEMWMKVS